MRAREHRTRRPPAVATDTTTTPTAARSFLPPSGRVGLKLGTSHDESRAERAADRVAQGRRPETSDVRGVSRRSVGGAVLPSVSARIESRRGRGAPLPVGVRGEFEGKMGLDFGSIRIHDDSEASSLAGVVGARAFTAGSDIFLGARAQRPESAEGRHLLAHELSHAAQQVGSPPQIQRTSGHTYDDADPLHDPSRLSDAEIEATWEFKALMGMNPVPKPGKPVKAAEARLAVRLWIRFLREQPPGWQGPPDLNGLLETARARLGTTSTAEGKVGDLKWEQVTGADVTTPSTSGSDFLRWLLAGDSKPNPLTGKMNCWELVLFSAHEAGHASEATLRKLYTDAKAAHDASGGLAFPNSIERALRTSNEYVYDPSDTNSPRPLRGDLVIFKNAAAHVALATGKMVGGQVEIVSHWPPPDGDHAVKRTTIEALMPATGVSTAKFWSPSW